MKARFGFTADDSEMTTRLICRVTGGDYSHALIAFYPEDWRDETWEPFYFESVWKRDSVTGKNGVRGGMDLPVSKILDWQSESMDRRFVELPCEGFLPFTHAECVDMMNHLNWATHTVRYAPCQIISNWITQRIRLRIAVRFGSQQLWTCSETPIRVMPSWAVDYYLHRSLSADDIPPSGRKLESLYGGTEALLRDLGSLD